MKFKVLDIKENNNQLIIEYETKFGIKRFRTSLDRKFIHLETGKPEWLHELRSHIERKYANFEKKYDAEPDFVNYIGKSFDCSKIEDRTPKALQDTLQIRKERMKKDREKEIKAVEEHNKEFERLIKEEKLIKKRLKLQIDKNNKLKELEVENGKKS